MTESILEIPPQPEQVRLARLVAVTAARLAGILDEDALDDIRLAVAEAAGRSVVRHAASGCTEAVRIAMRIRPDTFGVDVIDRATQDDADPGLALAVINGLVADARVESLPDGGEVLHLSWSLTD